ncbi:hypothetical protein LCGC14_2825640, partial [marine sediment metagenome]
DMKILIISKSGDGFGIAQKMQAEGHEIRIWVKEDGFDFVLKNIVEQVSSWRPSASNWADLVIADMVGFGRMATTLDNFEVPHVGFNQIADMMELDRAKQMQLFFKFGVETPETESFPNPTSAKSILEDWSPPGYVIKPSGNLDTGKTFVLRDHETYRWALEQFSGDQDLIVQRIVEGVEISTEGWFNGEDWLTPFNHTIEYKRFLAGNLGPNTGCSGNLVWAVDKPQKDKFVENLKKLGPFLKAAGYKGPIDINTIATSGGIFALEITARIGYDAIEALYEILEPQELGEVFDNLGRGGQPVDLPVKLGSFGIAVRLTVPPYPHRKADKRDKGLPILGVPEDFEHFYLTDVFLNNNLLQWSASDGVLMKVGASGKTIKEAISKVYERAGSVRAEGLQYRTDIA